MPSIEAKIKATFARVFKASDYALFKRMAEFHFERAARCYTVLLACGWLLFTPPDLWLIEREKRGLAASEAARQVTIITHGPPYSEVEVERINKMVAEFDAFLKWIDDHPVPPLEKWRFRRGFDTAEACHRYAEKQQAAALEAHFGLVEKLIKAPDEKPGAAWVKKLRSAVQQAAPGCGQNVSQVTPLGSS